jgi:hypothetical protein
MSNSERAQISHYWSQIQKKDAQIAALTAELAAERGSRERLEAALRELGLRTSGPWTMQSPPPEPPWEAPHDR